MSINKIALSFALVGILGATAAVAEESGGFIGVQMGYASAKLKMDFGEFSAAASSYGYDTDYDYSGYRYGIMGGYKQFFNEKFGLRYYGVLDYGTYEWDKSSSASFGTLNINANVDALFNFITNDTIDFGIFGGLSLGYTNHHPDNLDAWANSGENPTVGGFDAGINLGVRVNIVQHHGIELYSRIGLMEQEKEDSGVTLKYSQPYQIGIRYAFLSKFTEFRDLNEVWL